MFHKNIHILHGIYNNMCFDQCIYERTMVYISQRTFGLGSIVWHIPESLIEFILCCVKEVFDVGFMFSRTFSQL